MTLAHTALLRGCAGQEPTVCALSHLAAATCRSNIGNPINRALDLAQTNAPRADPRSCGGSVGEVTSSVRRLVEFLRADVASPSARLTVIHGVLGAFFAASRPFCGRWVSTGSPRQFRRTTRRRLRARTCHETGSDGLGIESCCAGAVVIRIVRCPCGGGQTRGQPSKYARLYFCPSCRVRIRGTADTEDPHPFVCGCIHGVSGRSRSH